MENECWAYGTPDINGDKIEWPLSKNEPPKMFSFITGHKHVVDKGAPIEMTQEAFDGFWSTTDQETFRVCHYEAAASL